MTMRTSTGRALTLAVVTLAALGCEAKRGDFFIPTGVFEERAEVTINVLVDGLPTDQDVSVTLSGSGGETQATTSNGRVTFTDVPPGMYTATITPPGGSLCLATTADVTVDPGDAATLDFRCAGVPRTYDTMYQTTLQTCLAEDPEPFSINAVFSPDADDPNGFTITFEGVEDSLHGLFDPATRQYTGQTEVVEFQPGVNGQESWNIQFSLDGSNPVFAGTSLVNVTFIESGNTCFIQYAVNGVGQ
jgi:hypothetical protein